MNSIADNLSQVVIQEIKNRHPLSKVICDDVLKTPPTSFVYSSKYTSSEFDCSSFSSTELSRIRDDVSRFLSENGITATSINIRSNPSLIEMSIKKTHPSDFKK
jgi:hypothetical protein